MKRNLISLAVASAIFGTAALAPVPAFAQSAEIEALKAQLATLSAKIDTTHATLSAKIDAVDSRLDKKIDLKFDELRADMKEMRAEMKEMRGETKDMRGETAEMRASIADLKAMQKAMLWVLGCFVALVTIASTVFTIAKTLHWL